MAVKLVISPDRSWCTDKILALVNWSTPSLPRKDILWLVPSGRAAEHLRRRLLEQSTPSPTSGVFLPDIKILSGWTDDTYRRMGEGHALIEDREIIIQHLVESSSYLKGSRYPGIIAKISQFVGQVKRNALSLEKLSVRMRSFNQRQTGHKRLSEKDKFLLEILDNYQNFLDDKTAIDGEDTVLWLSEGIIKDDPGLMDYLCGYKTLILDGFYYLAPSEEALVGVLMQNFPQTIMSIHADPRGKSNGEANCSISDGYLTFLGKIKKNHSYEVEEETASSSGSHAVFYENPANRVEEVRALARGIKATLLKNPDIPTDRIGVVFPSQEVYAPLIHEIFPQYGIAYQLGVKLSCSPLTQAYKKMLDLRCDGFLLDDLERFLSYRFITPLFTQEGREEFIRSLDIEEPGISEFDFPCFADFCREANISGGIDFLNDWLEPIRKFNYVRQEKTDPESAVNWPVVGNSLFYLKQFHSYLWRLPNTLTPADFQDTILDLTYLMQIPRNLLSSQDKKGQRIQQTKNMAAFNRIREILGQMTSELQFLAQHKYPLSTLRKLFLRYMARSEFSFSKAENNISIMGLSETGGLCFDTLFMGGLVEGELPQARDSNIFYRDGSGKFFDRPDRSEESKYLFRGLLNNCSGPIYLFAPKASEDKILFPSSVIDANWSPPEKSEDIYSHSELMERIALTRNTPVECRGLQDILQKIDPQTLEHIQRVQQIENMRAEPEPSHYQGILQDPENLVRLRERFTFSVDNPCHYSVSQLEEYARCPMQYFMDRILRLCPVPEITEEMEADERGKLVHKILEEYYRDISPEELSDQEGLRQRLRVTANRVFNKWAPPYHNAFWEVERKKLFSGMDGDDKLGILLRFWQNEQEQLQYSHPVEVEFSYGEESDYFCVGDIRLVGRVDRVDRLYETDSYLFFDYKTGKIPDLEDIAKGLSFQLPVYLMALTDHFKKKGSNLATGAGGYYAVGERGGGFEVKIKAFYGSASVENSLHSKSRNKNRFYNDSDLADEFHTIRERIRAIDQSIKEGKFPLPQADSKDIPCKYCDFKKICRRADRAEPGTI